MLTGWSWAGVLYRADAVLRALDFAVESTVDVLFTAGLQQASDARKEI